MTATRLATYDELSASAAGKADQTYVDAHVLGVAPTGTPGTNKGWVGDGSGGLVWTELTPRTVFDTHAARVDNPHAVTKAQVGLGNADNTSDANKPVSTATQTALDTHAALTGDGAHIPSAGITASLFKGAPSIADGQVLKWQSASGGAFVATKAVEDPGGGADGDMLVRSGSGFAVLAKGSTGQQLMVRTDGTIRWVSPPAVHFAAYLPVDDAVEYAGNASITTGTNVLNVTGGVFSTNDIGKAIIVGGAGAAGAVLATTISGRNSSTQVTLTANASTTVTNQGITYGTDNSTALQSALDAARGGRLMIERPTNGYALASQVSITPSSGSQVFLSILGSGSFNAFRWAGANGTAVFRTLGHKRSRVETVGLRFSDWSSNCIGWDCDADSSHTSSSQVTFADCNVTGNAPSGCIGWRLGHSSTGQDVSFYLWDNCHVDWSSVVGASAGWVIEGSNTLDTYWSGGEAYYCAKGITNTATAGGTNGGDAMFIFGGFGTSHNSIDFEFANEGTYSIRDGRYEVGGRFLNVPALGNTARAVDVSVNGVEIAGYTDAAVFSFNNAGQLSVRNSRIKNIGGSDYAATLFTVAAPGSNSISAGLELVGNKIQAADPCWTLTGNVTLDVHDNSRIDNAGIVTGSYKRYIQALASNTGGDNDLVRLDPNGKSVSASAFISFNNTRARVGYDSSGKAWLEGVGKPVGLKTTNGEWDVISNGDFAGQTAGKGLQVKEGSNCKQGTATLVAGTVTVANTSVTASSRIMLTIQSLGTVTAPKAIAVTARVAGTSFTIASADATDTSVIAYEIFEPA